MLIASFHSRALKQHQKPNTYLIEVVELYQALITMPVELSPSSVRGCDCWYGHGCELELPADSKLKFVRGCRHSLGCSWLRFALSDRRTKDTGEQRAHLPQWLATQPSICVALGYLCQDRSYQNSDAGHE